MRSSAPLRWRLLLPFFLGLACSGISPTEPPSPLQIAGLRATTIAVAPFNMALPMPVELKSSVQLVSDSLVVVLKGHGKKPQLIEDAVGNALWVESTEEVNASGGPRNFESAIRIFAHKVRQGVDFDAIIIPALYLQNARTTSVAARWDGATQRIEFRGRSREEIEMPPTRTIPAASLLVYVLDSEGEVIHTKRTGLELIQHMEIKIKKRQGYDQRIWTLKDDDPALEDETRLRAAVAHALYPYLPK